MSLIIDISEDRSEYLLMLQACRVEELAADRDVYTYDIIISGPLSRRLGEPLYTYRNIRIGTIPHTYNDGRIVLAQKALDLAQSWRETQGLQ